MDLSMFYDHPLDLVKSNRRVKFGVATNSCKFPIARKIDGVTHLHPAYSDWCGVLERSLSPSWKRRYKTYADVTVCDGWLDFNNFHSWWVDNFVEGWDLDKDVLTDERVYSPSTSIYLPKGINRFFIDRMAGRGAFLIGASFHKRDVVFESNISNPFTAKQEYLGRFNDELSAHLAWRRRKLEFASMMKDEMDRIDERIYPRSVEIISRMR